MNGSVGPPPLANSNPAWLYPLTAALGLLGLFTIMTNGFVIGFYRRKWQEAVPLMYIMISVCDSVTGVAALCHAFILTYYPLISQIIAGQYHGSRSISDLLFVIYLLLQSATRTSMFYNTVLAVVRTINITRPFYSINKTLLAISAIFYPVMLVLVTIKFNFSFQFLIFLYPIHLIETNLNKNVLYLTIPLVLPAIVCLVCAVIQIYSILKPSVISPPSNRERRMTMTIVMLTLVCLICNLPYPGVLLYHIVREYLHYYIYDNDLNDRDYYRSKIQFVGLSYLLHTLLPFIQAILNPAILLMRGAALRTFVVSTVRRSFNKEHTSLGRTVELEMQMVVRNNSANVGS